MHKRLIISALLGAFTFAAALTLMPQPDVAYAQTGTTPQPTFTGPSNAVQGTLFACPDAVAVQFTGTLISGWDVFYQVFNGAGAAGTALTNVRQVSGNGAFTFGERVPLATGTTLAAGSTISARVSVAREGNSARVDFEFTLTDIQDGCGSTAPTGTASSIDTGGSLPGTETTTTTTAVNLAAPGGTTLNPNLQPEPTVVVGARPSDGYRSQTPGLIFAECDDSPLALPGIVYDNDNVTVYWSWYTRTLAQMTDHLAHAQYSVKMNTASFNNVVRSEPPERRGNRYYTFFSTTVGYLRPGHYEIEYRVTWDQAVNDGYDDYGPGTSNPIDSGNCNFDVILNTTGAFVDHTNMFFPTDFAVYNRFND